MIKEKLFGFSMIMVVALACSCTAPLKNMPDDYKGLSYQRYQESASQVYNSTKTVVTQQEVGWTIDSTNTEGDKWALVTNFLTDQQGAPDSLRLAVTIQEDKGTLASLELQDSDSADVGFEDIYKQFAKPILDQLSSEYLSETTVDAYLEKTEPKEVNEEGFFDRIGFFANADGGYSVRYNAFVTNSTKREIGSPSPTEVEYANRRLSVADFQVRTGLAGIQFAEFNYSTNPGSGFQEQALAFNKDSNYGLEKYTYGVDLLPFWTLIFPSDEPGIHNFITRLLSARFRVVRELTQNSAQVTEPSVSYPSQKQIDAGTSYSFRTRYRYRSASIPLFLFMGNRGHLNIGVANWKFSRTYALGYTAGLGTQHIFDATVETVGPIVEFYFEIHESSLDTPIGRSGETIGEGWEGFRVDMFYGTGTVAGSRFNIEGGDYRELLNDDNVSIINHNFEINMSYPITLFSSANLFDVSLRIGGEANGFITYFKNHNAIDKSDWILNPWGKLSIEFN